MCIQQQRMCLSLKWIKGWGPSGGVMSCYIYRVYTHTTQAHAYLLPFPLSNLLFTAFSHTHTHEKMSEDVLLVHIVHTSVRCVFSPPLLCFAYQVHLLSLTNQSCCQERKHKTEAWTLRAIHTQWTSLSVPVLLSHQHQSSYITVISIPSDYSQPGTWDAEEQWCLYPNFAC